MFIFAFAPSKQVKEGEGVVRDEKRIIHRHEHSGERVCKDDLVSVM